LNRVSVDESGHKRPHKAAEFQIELGGHCVHDIPLLKSRVVIESVECPAGPNLRSGVLGVPLVEYEVNGAVECSKFCSRRNCDIYKE
jgi:hypothetical protein